MLNRFSCKLASVERVAIDRKPKTPTDGVQDPEVQRQLDAVRRIIDDTATTSARSPGNIPRQSARRCTNCRYPDNRMVRHDGEELKVCGLSGRAEQIRTFSCALDRRRFRGFV